jgi:hypothetical protein
MCSREQVWRQSALLHILEWSRPTQRSLANQV